MISYSFDSIKRGLGMWVLWIISMLFNWHYVSFDAFMAAIGYKAVYRNFFGKVYRKEDK